MEQLKMFGFPIAFDPATDKLAPQAREVSYEDTSRKFSKGMFGLLADSAYTVEDEPYYDFYKAIGIDADRSKFTERGLRYDSTVIMKGAAGDEYKKTAGHFHCQIDGKGMSYPELYQVIKGTAVFVMQKVENENQTEGKMVVEDCLFAEVHVGETIIIPPGYGHCTVNVGDETLVFINLVAEKSMNAYDAVKANQGMCCYVKKTGDGGYRLEQNPHYELKGTPRIVVPTDSARLDLKKGVPTYTAYLNNLTGFDYLTDPTGYVEDMMAVFKDK